ncbi:lipopolysaccharide-induced tumor necrosis factor-alpha factor homolog [Drosophila elegans]|uniref:lipopolysaccharide-induced tumor necrosis factor-alpha factor homolog n=1 Tax=Drosophila elegans TaxID=30023 RepID=UPI0007E702CF|nr:lipopolysaccharide-induced tumor necrosis factor-alpha factor homolog [Drosophila elegans]
MDKHIPLEQVPPSYNDIQPVHPNLNQTQPLIMVQPQPMLTLPNVLGNFPSTATCPSCGVRSKTNVEIEPNTKTHLIALLICALGGICCCCIPYLTDSCQSAKHTCSSCGEYVGTYRN